MADHDFNRSILTEVAHRPWPMPNGPWVMSQTWHDLLFAHWPVDPAMLHGRVPADLPLDLFDGRAWLGIVPFYMTNVAPRGLPSLPRISEFAELNVRTYVRVNDKPGVYFFSLDAASTVAVRAARALLNLPYYSATMRVRSLADHVEFESLRDSGRSPATLTVRYGPSGQPFQPTSGSLEYFLAERYCLYNRNRRGQPYRLDIHHPPWTLEPADADFARNTMAQAAGLLLPRTKPLLHFSRRQDAVAWTPTAL